jgi:hypothetical protein
MLSMALLTAASNTLNLEASIADMPHTVDALKGPEATLWDAAIRSELDSIKQANMYELINPSVHLIPQIIGNKIVLCQEPDKDGNISWYKAQLTVQGDQQHDFIESFAPVVKSASMQVFFTLCT